MKKKKAGSSKKKYWSGWTTKESNATDLQKKN